MSERDLELLEDRKADTPKSCSDVELPIVMPGQTAQIIVQAVNLNLQGVASDPVAFTVPLPQSRTADIAPALEPRLAQAPLQRTAAATDTPS